MNIIGVKTDNITDYKKTSILIAFPNCHRNCEDCQNKKLRQSKLITVTTDDIVNLYNQLNTHNAIVMAGLEPFDSLPDVYSIISSVVKKCSKTTDIIIYTGYSLVEVANKIFPYLEKSIKQFLSNEQNNLIIKFGEYDKTKAKSWFNKTLGINLATTNQGTVRYCYNKNQIEIEVENYGE